MADKHQEQVAGVTLWFKSSSRRRAPGDEKFLVSLELDGAVRDEELWKTVETKFKEGFRVFTGDNFHIEVMDVMRESIKDLEARLLAAERALARERDERGQLEQELQKYKSPLAEFGRALRGEQ